VLPAFNEAGVLEENLQVIQAHLDSLGDRYRFEVLLVDDGSTDSTAAVADALAARFANIRVLRHPHNFGLGQAFKTAFAASRGDYVVTMDVDLSYSADHIGRLLEAITSTRAKLVLASAYMEGGQVTNVPTLRRVLSIWGNRFLRLFARGRLSTLTCMVRAYDGPFIRSMILRSTGMEIMPEVVYKAMILRGQIEEIPAHLDWSRQIQAGPRRSSSMRILKHVLSTVISGFIFRPFVMLMLPGLVLLAFSAYVNFWVVAVFLQAMSAVGGDLAEAAGIVYRDHPQTLFIGTLSLVLAIQLISLGALSLQSKKYFEETYYADVQLRRLIDRLAERGERPR
jgi:glycosyltransferase involved in cell wall biosynthesis